MNPNNPYNTSGTIQQGQNFYQNGQNVGTVQFDPQTGRRLNTGEYTKILPPVSPTINGSGLGQGSGLNLPNRTPETGYAGLDGNIQSGLAQNAYNSELERQSSEANSKVNSSQGDYKSIIEKLAGIGDTKFNLQKEAGIYDKKKIADDLDAQILSERSSINKKKDLIYGNGSLSKNQADALFGEENRKSISSQTDLSIQNYVANNNLNRAESLINDKIKAETESLKTQADYYKDILNRNQDSLSETKKAKLQDLATQADREYQQVKDDKKNAYDMFKEAAKNGLPQSEQKKVLEAISKGDYKTASMLSGQYQTDPLDRKIKQAQLQKLYSDNATSASKGKLLSIAEAKSLGLPYGTTQGEAIAMGKVPGEVKQATELKASALTTANEILQAYQSTLQFGKSLPIGLNSIFGTIPGTTARDFSVKFNNLKALLSLDNIKYLKGQGQISDAERLLLEQASSKLDRSLSWGEFGKTLNETIKILNGPKMVLAPDGTMIEIID